MIRSVVDESPPKRKLKGAPAAWGIIVVIIPRPSRRISTPKSMVLVDTIMSLPFYCGGAVLCKVHEARTAFKVAWRSIIQHENTAQKETSPLENRNRKSCARRRANW